MRGSTGSLWLLTAIIAAMSGVARAADTPTSRFRDSMEQRMLGCTACHGAQGEGLRENDYYPRISGKPAGYLFNQLVNFRDGRRKYPQMTYLLNYLSDDYLREIAEHFANLRPPYPVPTKPTVSNQVITRGQELVTSGDAAKDIPACVACHGKALAGLRPGIPGLMGVPPEYI